ncbi:MAG TPA: pyruvate kinase alpha/beta domain-containing protein, partial [Actinomycetota bacterium]|nr:pyruvate kinase alpha/beta domain-containing protein [Actinomycetota bacterium]
RAVGRMTLFHGVTPRRCATPQDTDAMIAMMDRALREADAVPTGATVVMVASSPAGRTHANLLKVHHVGS